MKLGKKTKEYSCKCNKLRYLWTALAVALKPSPYLDWSQSHSLTSQSKSYSQSCSNPLSKILLKDISVSLRTVMSKSPATLYSLALYPMIQADICLKFHCSWSLVLIRMHRKNLPTSFKPAWMFKTSWEGHSPSASWAYHLQRPLLTLIVNILVLKLLLSMSLIAFLITVTTAKFSFSLPWICLPHLTR